jgi:LysM repeat protein
VKAPEHRQKVWRHAQLAEREQPGQITQWQVCQSANPGRADAENSAGIKQTSEWSHCSSTSHANHTVRKGETLAALAKRYNVKVAAIRLLNEISTCCYRAER